jgi:hypothetical protein
MKVIAKMVLEQKVIKINFSRSVCIFFPQKRGFTLKNFLDNHLIMNHDVKITEMTGGSHSSRVGVVLGSVGAVIVLIGIGFILFLCKRKKKISRSEVFVDVQG